MKVDGNVDLVADSPSNLSEHRRDALDLRGRVDEVKGFFEPDLKDSKAALRATLASSM